VGKSSNNVFAERDEWFWRGNTPEASLFKGIVKSTFKIMLGDSDLRLIKVYQQKIKMFSGAYQI
jgi:hypothetical protein